jgi:hypothetical protein
MEDVQEKGSLTWEAQATRGVPAAMAIMVRRSSGTSTDGWGCIVDFIMQAFVIWIVHLPYRNVFFLYLGTHEWTGISNIVIGGTGS